jgi:hypothetical protein
MGGARIAGLIPKFKTAVTALIPRMDNHSLAMAEAVRVITIRGMIIIDATDTMVAEVEAEIEIETGMETLKWKIKNLGFTAMK